MKKIGILSLNTAIDHLVKVEHFEVGKIIRSTDSLVYPSGKGINSARCLEHLKCSSLVTGYIGEDDSQFFQSINSDYIKTDFLQIPGSTRNNITIVTNEGSLVSHLQNKGFSVSEKDNLNIQNRVVDAFLGLNTLIISGSLPSGFSNVDFLGLLKKINTTGVKIILDTSDESLLTGIKASPYLVKPNLEEFESITRKKYANFDEIVREMVTFKDKGISILVVSLGKEGALFSFFETKKIFKAEVTKGLSHTTNYDEIGCGDSMIAGVAYAINQEMDNESVVRAGMAAGIANLFKSGPGNIDTHKYHEMFKNVRIETLDNYF